MKNKLIRLVQKPFEKISHGLILTITIFFILPYLVGNYIGDRPAERIIITLAIFIILIVITDLLFRFFYRLYFGEPYPFVKKTPFKIIQVEPHPYLPFIFKKIKLNSKTEKLDYPLHHNYYAAKLTPNNYRFLNGPNGNKDIIVPKPKNLVRINCIGGSTTMNYLSDNENNFSYPLELEKILKLKSSKELEVNNFGMGGYNSADLLVHFSLQIIDTEPDYLIIYHGYNDIQSYLTPNFKSDYSHYRRNLGEIYWRFSIASKFPNIPIKFFNYIINKWFPNFRIQNHLTRAISQGYKIDPKIDYSQGLRTYERNLKNIISISLSNDIQVILSTFCIYLHKKIKDDPLHILYKKIVLEENKIIKKLAKNNNLKIVDCYSLIPKDDSNFVDSIHFTPKGMRLLAESISKVIKVT